MIVYVGQCGEVYSGPTFPEHHGKVCDEPEDHIGRHRAPIIRNGRPDFIEFYDPRQKAFLHELSLLFADWHDSGPTKIFQEGLK